MQRTRKDKRARAYALRASFLLIYLVAYIGFIVRTAADGWTGVFYAFIFGTGTIAAILMRRWHRKQDELLNFSLTGQNRQHPRDQSTLSPQVRSYMEERALIVASLLARCASELYLHQQDHAGTEVATRQAQNTFLRDHGLWLKLEQPELDLATVADGQWTLDQCDHVGQWCEQLRLLRWTLGVDAEILPLAHSPKLDFSLAVGLLQQPQALRGKTVINAWDVRIQRDIALEYTARVVAELKARDLISPSPELDVWADEFRAKSLGASSDYLAGSQTIAELENDALRLLGAFAAARERYASYLIELLNSTLPIPFSVWLTQSRSTHLT